MKNSELEENSKEKLSLSSKFSETLATTATAHQTIDFKNNTNEDMNLLNPDPEYEDPDNIPSRRISNASASIINFKTMSPVKPKPKPKVRHSILENLDPEFENSQNLDKKYNKINNALVKLDKQKVILDIDNIVTTTSKQKWDHIKKKESMNVKSPFMTQTKFNQKTSIHIKDIRHLIDEEKDVAKIALKNEFDQTWKSSAPFCNTTTLFFNNRISYNDQDAEMNKFTSERSAYTSVNKYIKSIDEDLLKVQQIRKKDRQFDGANSNQAKKSIEQELKEKISVKLARQNPKISEQVSNQSTKKWKNMMPEPKNTQRNMQVEQAKINKENAWHDFIFSENDIVIDDELNHWREYSKTKFIDKYSKLRYSKNYQKENINSQFKYYNKEIKNQKREIQLITNKTKV